MKHKLYNRLLSLALALGLVVGMLPGMTFAGAVDTTAPQSQAEQIAEPTEEPEANDAPQAEPRVGWGDSEGTFYVQHVDENGNQIGQPSTETIEYNRYNNSTSVDSYVETNSNYEYQYATIDGNQVTQIRVSRESGLIGYYYLEYYSDKWYEVRENFTLTLHYRNTAEPEPTPDPSGDLWIEDDIIDTGRFVAHIEEASAEQVDHYVWYRSESKNGNYTEVARVKVTGDEYNVAAAADNKGNWVNVAYDRLYQENNNELDTTMRYWYKVAAVDAAGNTIATSEAEMVPYYFALQNGSFEVPQGSGSDDMMQQIPVSTNGLIWKTTGLGTGSHRNQDIEILNPFLNSRAAWDNYYLDDAYNTTTGVPDGNQVAELNCEAWGALYQDVLTVPLSTLNWQYYHRGRFGTNNRMDEMQLLIENVKDIEAGFDPAHGDQSGQSYFVDSSTANRSKWEYNSGSYEVPASQFVSRFYFTSVSSYNGTTDAANSTVGNLLDDVAFTTHPLDPTPDKGTLTVTKRVEGFETIPADYEVKITIRNGDYTASDTLTAYEFTAAGEGVFTATASFNNIDPGQYTITEEVTGVPDGYDKNEQEQTAADVVADTITPATLTNTYTEDTSDEYPVRFYLQDVNGDEMYNFEDDWGILPSYLQSGFANVATSETPASDYVTTNIQGHDAVQNWIKANGYDPGINMNDVGTVLQNLINQGYITRGTQVATINGDSVTANEIINNSSDYSIVYVQATSNNDKLNKEGYKRGNVTYDNEGYPWQKSYHVHLSIRKNPGDLTITKTFAGLDEGVVPENFAIEVKASNGTLIDTLTLDEATKADGVYTWTLENLNEDTYTVTEIKTDVDNKALNVAYEVKDTSEETVESGNTTSAKVSVAGNETSSVAFTNTYTDAEGVLTITKVLENSQQATNGKPVFDFKITSQKEDGTVYYVHIDMSNPETNNKELTLPAGTYKVEELDSLNYEQIDVEGLDGNECVEVGGTDKTVTFTNTADNSNIPSDSGATQNNPSWGDGNVITWNKDDKIICNPEDPGKKPDSTEN